MNKALELKNCTSIKSILMLMIVLYHSMVMYAGGTWGPQARADEAPVLGHISEGFNFFLLYAFNLISGYIFYYIKYENDGYQEYLPFLAHKAKRLLVPYAFISVIWVAPVYFCLEEDRANFGFY